MRKLLELADAYAYQHRWTTDGDSAKARAALQAEVEMMQADLDNKADIAQRALAERDWLQEQNQKITLIHGVRTVERDSLRAELEAARKYAALGRIAIKFVDRAGDYCDIDPAERICDQFHKAMSDAIDAAIGATK